MIQLDDKSKTMDELFELGYAAEDAGDFVKAIEFYRQAANTGEADCEHALWRIGSVYERQGDCQTAFKFYLEAAEKGSDDGMFFVGSCYENGTGVEKNFDEALKWYNKAAAAGNEIAEEYLEYLGY